MVSSDFVRQIEGYGLTTACIFYHLPDHPTILQQYVWQEYDLAPRFPELSRFLEFWQQRIEGKLHSVRVGHQRLISAREVRAVTAEFRLN